MSEILKKRIMRRIYFVWFIRRLLDPAMVKLYIMAAALWQIGRLVWVSEVFNNAPTATNVGANINFFSSAFLNTELSVQALLVVLILAGVWFAKDAIFAPFWGNLSTLRVRRHM